MCSGCQMMFELVDRLDTRLTLVDDQRRDQFALYQKASELTDCLSDQLVILQNDNLKTKLAIARLCTKLGVPKDDLYKSPEKYHKK